MMNSLPGGLYGFLAMVSAAVFLLAFFLDFFELAFIIVPLLKPAAEAIFRTSPPTKENRRHGLTPFLVDMKTKGIKTNQIVAVEPPG